MNIEADVGLMTDAVSGRQWDRTEFRRQVATRVGGYQARQLRPGDRVLIHFGNRLEFFAELLAIWSVGGCAIPVDSRLTPFEVETLIDAAAPRFSVIDDVTNPAVVESVPASRLLNTLEPAETKKSTSSGGLYPKLDDDALILFTSGSTGNPKGVVHTHRSLNARWTTLRQSLGLSDYVRSLCVLPTHFGHGLICNCLFPWLSGCDLIIAPPFKSDLIMRLGALIDEYRISCMSSVPSIWSLALKTARAPENNSLRRIHVGSAPLSKSMWTRVQQWSGIQEVFNTYGITETGSWVAGTTGGKVIAESGLIGEPWGATIKIIKTEEAAAASFSLEECTAGVSGMVWLNTPALMKGYFQRQDLTDAAVQQGWFKTGDIGLLDDRGRLYLKGRKRDEINKGGIKIFPADIDDVVEQYSLTSKGCTFGFRDDFYGENVGIALVLDDTSEQSIRGLHEWVSSHLAQHKHPERWYLLDEIPTTNRGKVNRDQVMKVCIKQKPLDLRALLRGRKQR